MVRISALVITAILLGPHHALGAEGAAKCEGGNCPQGARSLTMLQRGSEEDEADVSSPEEAEHGAHEGETDVSGPEEDELAAEMQIGHDQEDIEIDKEMEESSILEGSVMVAGRRVYNYHMRGLQEGRGRVGANMSDYMVWLLDNTTDAQIDELCEAIETDLGHPCLWKGRPSEGGLAFLDFSALEEEFLPELASLIERFPFIDFTEPVMNASFADAGVRSEGPRSWGLDRIDDQTAAKDDSYNPGLGADGEGVTVYVLDTGVFINHEDFEGRAVSSLDMTTSRGKWECKGEAKCAEDIHGHGSHCAGTVAGKTAGVAKKASIAGVKVLSNSGSGYTSWITGAMDWIGEFAKKPAVVSMSLGGPGRSTSYERAVNGLVKDGITVVVAAGNSNSDACYFSPAWVDKAITVGSTFKNGNSDKRSGFSNYGECLDIYAPGASIQSLGTSRGRFATMSGTSMACPHVAGAAALALGLDGDLSPDEVQTVLEDWALPDLVDDAKTGSPNLMLFVGPSIKTPKDILGNPDARRRRTSPAPTPTPTSNKGPGVTYKNMGRGRCTGQTGAKYLHAAGHSKCKSTCTESSACSGYSVSSYHNCLTFDGPNVRGKGPEWGAADCYLKISPTSPSPTPSPTLSPTPSPTLSPTPWPTLSPTSWPTAAPTSSPTAFPTPWPTEPPYTTPEPEEPEEPEYTTPEPEEPKGDFNGEFESASGKVYVSQGEKKAHIEYEGKNGTKMEMTVPGVYKMVHDDHYNDDEEQFYDDE